MTNILEIKNINKRFGGIEAIGSCSLDIKEKEITAVIGPNGSGKTTLFNLISNLIKLDSGQIYFSDTKINALPDFKIAKLGISRTFQEVRLFKNLTIKEHLEIALSEDNEYLLTNLFRKPKNNEEKIKEILALVNLQKPFNTSTLELSYGQRKLLDLAIALAKPHTLLMLDEPVSGLNPALRNEIKTILKRINKRGETILLIEHDMNFVMDLAHYVYVLDEGKIIAKGKPKQIQKNKKVLQAYLGE